MQGFAKGPDGGRDTKFVRTAELHPSRAAPWIGTTIIQAKHTNSYNRNFSESDFFSTTAQNTVLGKEIPRVKKLRESKQIDRYMLFANRRLAGNAKKRDSLIPRKAVRHPRSRFICAAWSNRKSGSRVFPRLPAKRTLIRLIRR